MTIHKISCSIIYSLHLFYIYVKIYIYIRGHRFKDGDSRKIVLKNNYLNVSKYKDGYFLSLSTIIDTTNANIETISPEKLIISCNASNTDKSLLLSSRLWYLWA